MNPAQWIGTIVFVQLFYAFAITSYIYALPADAVTYTSSASGVASTINAETISTEINSGLENQRNIPALDLGALVFYSGNVILDMLANFVTAIPQMVILLLNIIFGQLIAIDPYILSLLELTVGIILQVMYVIGLMQMLINIRSGRGTFV